MNITWESIGTPAGLGALVSVLMLLLFKPLIQYIMESAWKSHHSEPMPDPWPLRSLIMNGAALFWCLLFAGWHVSPSTNVGLGEAFVLAIGAWVFSTGEYELAKNVLGIAGVDLQKVGFLTTKLGARE